MEVAEENEIVEALKSHGLDDVAVRLVQLRELLEEDPDEPDLVIESLRSFADFLLQTALQRNHPGVTLEPLDDSEEWAAHRAALAKAGAKSR